MFHWKLPHKEIRCPNLMCLSQEFGEGQCLSQSVSAAEQQSCAEPLAPQVPPCLTTWIDYCVVFKSKRINCSSLKGAWRTKRSKKLPTAGRWGKNPIYLLKKPWMLCTFQGCYEETCSIAFALFHLTVYSGCMWKRQECRNTEQIHLILRPVHKRGK